MSAPRVAIVTGAALGIGRTTAVRLHGDGCCVAIADIDELTLAAADAPDDSRMMRVPGDLSAADGARTLIDAVLERWGRLDVLVNNAGGGVIRPFLDHDDASLEQTLSRNLLTTIHCCRMALPAMIEQGGGRIVNVGAESVRNGLLAHAMYNAAKGGVHGLTTGLAREFAPHAITVNCVAPSIVETELAKAWIAAPETVPPSLQPVLEQAIDLIPMGRAAQMDEVAAVIAFLASEEASFVTGQVVSVNGASSML